MADEWDQVGQVAGGQPGLPAGIRQDDVNQASEAISGQSADDPWAQVGQISGGSRGIDPVKQATSASAAAAADNSWFSPEFRSGALFKEVLGPAGNAAYTAAQVAGRVMGRALGPLAETPVTTFKPGAVDYAATAPMGVPPQKPGETTIGESMTGIPSYVQQAASEALDETTKDIQYGVKVNMPLYWAGKGYGVAARALNPQGPPAARAIRTGLEAASGVLETGSEAVAGMITPLNIGIALAPELLPLRAASVANKALAAGFLLKAFADTPGQWERYQVAKTTKEKAGIVAETLVSYAPAAAFLHLGRAESRAAAAARKEEPTTEPVGTTEVPPETIGVTKDELNTAVQGRIDELKQRQAEGPLAPADQAEMEHLEEGLGEHGDIHELATRFGFHITDEEAPAATTETAPATEAAAPDVKAGPRTEEEAPVTETARAGEQRKLTREEFIARMKARQDELNSKSPLSDAERSELSEINTGLGSGQTEALARKLGFTLTKGGEINAIEPGNAQVEGAPAPLGEQEGTPGAESPTGSGDNVVGETQGTGAGGPVPQEAVTEPVVATEAKAELTPEEQALADRKAKLLAEWDGKVELPSKLEAALAKAEQSGAERDNKGATAALKEVRRLLARSRGLSKPARESALNRVARVESAIKGKPIPASTAESADANVVKYAGNTYYRTDEIDGVGVWHKDGPSGRSVSNPDTRAHLDTVWQARKAIAEDIAEQAAKLKEKKAAPKTEPTATPVPTTAPKVSREEIGKGEAQPPAPGTKVNHWTWDDGEVVGPGKKPDHSLVRFKDGSEMQFDNKVIRKTMIPRAEAKAKGLDPDTNKPAKTAKPEEPVPNPTRKEVLQKNISVAEARLKSKIDELGNKLKPKELKEIRDELKANKEEFKKILEKEQKADAKLTEQERLKKLKTATAEQAVVDRELMRKRLEARMKKEKFEKGQFVQVGRGGTETVDSFNYKGLAIHEKAGAPVKAWLVSHSASGKLVGHFDSLNDAKAFVLRAIDHGFDFTKSWNDFVAQKQRFGTAQFAEFVSDPYGFLADAAQRVRNAADKNAGGYFDPSIMRDAYQIGRRMYQRGMAFRDWAVNMVKHLGERIIEHLRDMWDSITGRNILPHARQRGGMSTGGHATGPGVPNQYFATRAEAEKFVADNKSKILSHSIIQQSGVPGVQLNYRLKPGAVAGGPVITPKGAIVLPKYDATKFAGPPVVNAGSGATIKPPPPGSALGPTPPGSNPHALWMQRSISAYQRSWEKFWPGAYAAFRLEKKTPVINIHQQWIAEPLNAMNQLVKADFYQKVKGLTREQVVAWEHDARTKYNAMRAAGQGEQQALLNSIKGNPLRDYFLYRESRNAQEKMAAGILNVKIPGYIEGPYLPRLTTRENQILVKIGGAPEGVVTQLRRSMGSFDKSREHETMKEGIAKGTQYREPIEAIIQRERVSEQLIATAKALKSLEDGGVIFRKASDALANSKDKNPIKMEGFGGDTWWVRNRQEARFIDQNLNNAGSKSPWNTASQVINNYARNPNLWNPLPHITKNMFFKYILARVNNFTLKADTTEFTNATNPQLIAEFHKVFSMPGDQPGTTRLTHSNRMPDIVARETQNWAAKITRLDLGINGASQKYIFEKADPAMRYSLWKSYIRKGMDYQEAANNVFFDLVRYDENSGGLNFWKQVPFNFFSTWRTGSYVTMYKALTTHPIRTLLFFGAVEYIREAIYRNTGQWTHLPIDYLDAPLSEGVESIFKAKKEIALGRNPLLASRDVAVKAGAIMASAALFGPGGGQAPDTISDLMKLVQGDPAQLSRVTNMFWGLSQLFNMPQEFLAWKKDGDSKHLVNIVSGAAMGTHAAIKYEPRRLGKFIFPEWLPGMQYTPEQQGFAALREKREAAAMKAAGTHEQRHGITRGWWQGPEEQQTEDLLRGSGLLKDRRPRRGGGL